MPRRVEPACEGRSLPALERLLPVLGDQFDDLAGLLRRKELLDPIGEMAVIEQPTGRAAAKSRLLTRLGAESVAQQIREEMVVAKPLARGIRVHEEK